MGGLHEGIGCLFMPHWNASYAPTKSETGIAYFWFYLCEQVMVIQSKGYKTMAIGDGANDVGAIEQADIGVGIKGTDGAIAARKADFAISRYTKLSVLLTR